MYQLGLFILYYYQEALLCLNLQVNSKLKTNKNIYFICKINQTKRLNMFVLF